MRVALVTGGFPPSGESVATTVKHLVDEAVRRGDRPLVLTSGLGPATYRGVPVLRGTTAATVDRALAVGGDAGSPDLVHVADPRLLGAGAVGTVVRAAHRRGLPVLVSHHSVGSGPLADGRGHRPVTGADRSLATCLSAQALLAAAGEPAGLWRPGVDADLYAPTARDDRLAERWARGDRLVVGHVGPVDKPAVRRRLAAVAALPGVRLVALRAGGAGARLRRRAPGAQVIDEMSGVDLAAALACCDLVVAARQKDLDAHGPRRALASGVPVVGFRAGGLPDLVAHRVNGVLVDPGDDRALLAAVTGLREDRERLAFLAGRARASVAGRTWAVAYEELVRVHYAAMSGRTWGLAPAEGRSRLR